MFTLQEIYPTFDQLVDQIDEVTSYYGYIVSFFHFYGRQSSYRTVDWKNTFFSALAMVELFFFIIRSVTDLRYIYSPSSSLSFPYGEVLGLILINAPFRVVGWVDWANMKVCLSFLFMSPFVSLSWSFYCTTFEKVMLTLLGSPNNFCLVSSVGTHRLKTLI